MSGPGTTAAQSLSHILTLCSPMDSRPPGSFVHGISQAKILEWVAISFSRGSSWPLDWTGRIFTISATWEDLGTLKWREVAQYCLILCDPMDCSLPGFSINGIFQARVLEWVARGSSQPRDQTLVSCIAGRHFPSEPQGKLTGTLRAAKIKTSEIMEIQRLSTLTTS